MAFERTDQDAGEANRNLSTALARRTSGNSRAARDVRTRVGNVAMSNHEPLIVCGAYSLDGDGSREWQCIPLLWRCGDADTTTVQIHLNQEHQTPGVVMEWGAAATTVRSFPQIPTNPTVSVSNSSALTTLIALDLDVAGVHNGDYFLIWLFAKGDVGALIGDDAGTYDNWEYMYDILDNPNPLWSASMVPCWAVEYEGAIGAKAYTFADSGEVPATRQMIRTMQPTGATRTRGFIWPPHDVRNVEATDLDPGSVSIKVYELAWAKLFSVSVQDQSPALPEILGAFNAGQPAATVPWRQIYGDAERVFLSHTKAFAIGSWPSVAEFDPFLAGNVQIDPWASHSQMEQVAWVPIGSTAIGQGDSYRDLATAEDFVRASVRVTCFIAFTGPSTASTSETKVQNIDVRLRAFDPLTGGSETSTDPYEIGAREMKLVPARGNSLANSNAAAVLLHYPWGSDNTTIGANTTLCNRHALRGGLPRDVWESCEAYYLQLDLDVDSTALRVLNLEVRNSTGVAKPWSELIRAHLIAWHVEETPSDGADAVRGIA